MSSQIQQLVIRYWFRVLLTVLFCISTVWFGIHQSYGWLGVSLCLLVPVSYTHLTLPTIA